jgi:hypothetical protein
VGGSNDPGYIAMPLCNHPHRDSGLNRRFYAGGREMAIRG